MAHWKAQQKPGRLSGMAVGPQICNFPLLLRATSFRKRPEQDLVDKIPAWPLSGNRSGCYADKEESHQSLRFSSWKEGRMKKGS